MKTYLLHIAFLFMLLNLSYAQPEGSTSRIIDTTQLGSSTGRLFTILPGFDESYSLLEPFSNGDTIVVNAEKLYPINEKRFTFYQEMHEFIQKDADPDIVIRLVDNFRAALDLNKTSYDSLLLYSTKIDSLVDSLNQFSVLNLDEVRNNQLQASESLKSMNDQLEGVQESLQQTQDYIKKGKLWSKLAIIGAAIGGFLVGTLTD